MNLVEGVLFTLFLDIAAIFSRTIAFFCSRLLNIFYFVWLELKQQILIYSINKNFNIEPNITYSLSMLQDTLYLVRIVEGGLRLWKVYIISIVLSYTLLIICLAPMKFSNYLPDERSNDVWRTIINNILEISLIGMECSCL